MCFSTYPVGGCLCISPLVVALELDQDFMDLSLDMVLLFRKLLLVHSSVTLSLSEFLLSTMGRVREASSMMQSESRMVLISGQSLGTSVTLPLMRASSRLLVNLVFGSRYVGKGLGVVDHVLLLNKAGTHRAILG